MQQLKIQLYSSRRFKLEQNKILHICSKHISTKRTETILDTAKTVQVITEKALQDQGLLSLQQALATTPGISFGAGEGGGGYGDKINLRGYDATYNTTVDGLRDAALTNDSDLFSEAVEIIKVQTLTGLPNRSLLHDRLRLAIAQGSSGTACRLGAVPRSGPF